MVSQVRYSLPLAVVFVLGCASTRTPPSADAPAAQACTPVTEQQVAALFDRWNASLASGDAHRVVANYAPGSVLLPTVSNRVRVSDAEKEDYFEHFLENRPNGTIDERHIRLGCNSALDTGLYTFTFAKTGVVVRARYSYTYAFIDGRWLITSHHSSAMPGK